MSGRHRFKDLVKDLPASRWARIEEKKMELHSELRLQELRQAREITQMAVGAALNVKQPAVAKLERRADVYVSSLRA